MNSSCCSRAGASSSPSSCSNVHCHGQTEGVGLLKYPEEGLISRKERNGSVLQRPDFHARHLPDKSCSISLWKWEIVSVTLWVLSLHSTVMGDGSQVRLRNHSRPTGPWQMIDLKTAKPEDRIQVSDGMWEILRAGSVSQFRVWSCFKTLVGSLARVRSGMEQCTATCDSLGPTLTLPKPAARKADKRGDNLGLCGNHGDSVRKMQDVETGWELLEVWMVGR